jgi:hypothetical protein
MSKFLVTSGSYFEPFTYDELAKPIMQTVEAHNAAQEQYDTLTSETEALRQYLLREPENSEARRMYDNYTAKLQALQDNLWRNGYSVATRRDLSAARAGYASDVTRLGTAIKARQDRSNEYWKIKHEHPDMIMSSDPGLEKLDKYLADDTFGQNYYSYSGEQFMNEVAADAKARANEFINDPEILEKHPELAGYIPVLQKNGFTSKQVEAASYAVEMAYAGDKSYLEALAEGDPLSLILANILSSHIESTGARNKVDTNEFGRLLRYGKAGLSQAIGKSEVNYMKDNEYAYDQEMRAAREKANLEVQTYGRKKAIDAAYKSAEAAAAAQQELKTNTGETISMESPVYQEWVKATRGQAKHYENGQTHTIQTNGGRSLTAHNEYEMSNYLYETNGRTQIRAGYGGYDIAFDPKKKGEDYSVRLKDGREVTVNISKMEEAEARRLGLDPEHAVAVKNKNGTLQEAASRQITLAREDWLQHVKQYKEANPDIEKYAIDPKEQKKLRERYEYPATAPWEDFYSYMATKATKGDFSSVSIANDSSHDYAKKNLARAIIREYNSNSTDKHGKSSRFAFYEVTDGNTGRKKEGVTDIRQIFGTKNSGTELRDDTLTNISATLEDLAAERPMIRIQTSVNPGKTFLVDATLLGPLFENNFTDMVRETGMSNSEMIDYCLLPILHPEAVYSMSQKAAEEWSRTCDKYVEDFPVIANRANGTARLATPREILRDKDLQEWLRESVMNSIANPSAQRIRQAIGQNHEQYIGDQSQKAEELL